MNVLLFAIAGLVLLPILRWTYRMFFVDTSTPPKPDELVVVATPDSEVIANIIRDQLEQAGIRAMARNVHPLSYYPGFPRQWWEVRVKYADLERAREVLGDQP